MDELIEQCTQLLNFATLVLEAEMASNQPETAGRTDATMSLLLVVTGQLKRLQAAPETRWSEKKLDQYSEIMVEIFDILGGVMAQRIRRVLQEEARGK